MLLHVIGVSSHLYLELHFLDFEEEDTNIFPTEYMHKIHADHWSLWGGRKLGDGVRGGRSSHRM